MSPSRYSPASHLESDRPRWRAKARPTCSDYPQIGLGVTANALDRLDLSDDEKAKIRSGNAMKLFGR